MKCTAVGIGKRIADARSKRNMTLEDVANLCNTTRQTIFKYENEIITNIPYERFVLLAKALGVTPAFLYGADQTEEELILIDKYRQLSNQSKALVQLVIDHELKR